jgi:hypothetical protein
MTTRLLACGAFIALTWSAPGFTNEYEPPRLSDGRPDFQGVWTNATATPMERPSEFGDRRAYTLDEAKQIEAEARGRVAADAAPSDPNKKIEAAVSLPPVGNYNLFWTDRGMTAALIDGEYRTSMIIEPSNGRFPPLTESARKRNRPVMMFGADGPEQRSLGERCLLSFGSSAGPPMLPTMYNSYYQIVQSPDHVMILVEMVHDARIVRIGDEHITSSVRQWMGDSVGRWDGDTLVVTTKNFRQDQSFRGAAENLTVTERLTRVAQDQLLYRFTIEDPTMFTAPTVAELPFMAVDASVYEYACHEGNYALPGILAAEREAEKAAAAKKN